MRNHSLGLKLDRMFTLSRRRMLQCLGWGGLGAVLGGVPGCASLSKRGGLSRERRLADLGPIDRSRGDGVAEARFTGDEPDSAHAALRDRVWNAEEYPGPTESVPLVIVGGGMSGLISAFLARAQRPVLLERAARLGGNAKGESWRGTDYSIGAAYFCEQETGSPLWKLFREADIHSLCRVKEEEDPVAFRGKIFADFWKGETAGPEARQFHQLKTHFVDLLRSRNGLVYPDIPIVDPRLRAGIEALDRQTYHDYLVRVAGGPLHPHIDTALEHYCWSTLGASTREISAAAGLNQYSAEFGKIFVAPGGNSAVAEGFLRATLKEVPLQNFRTGTTVIGVRVVEDGVLVTCLESSGKLKTIHARVAILACPKFVVARILHGIEEERLHAIRRLKYRSYLVANALLKRPVEASFYDLFLLGEGKVDPARIAVSAGSQGATDVISAGFAGGAGGRRILTLYRGMPYDPGRAELFSPGGIARYRTEFELQLRAEILPLLKLNPEDLLDLRITRWGHPLPVPMPGLIADGTLDRIRKPFREKVFFVEQDNWALPALETCATEALTWLPEVLRRL